jgi:hypothetical protein
MPFLSHYYHAPLIEVYHCAVLALECLLPSEDVYVKDSIKTVPSMLEIRQL